MGAYWLETKDEELLLPQRCRAPSQRKWMVSRGESYLAYRGAWGGDVSPPYCGRKIWERNPLRFPTLGSCGARAEYLQLEALRAQLVHSAVSMKQQEVCVLILQMFLDQGPPHAWD